MTEADLLDALRKAQAVDSVEGWTSRELCQIFAMSYRRLMIYLRDMIQSGTMEYAGTRIEIAIDGKRAKVPVYRLVQPRD